ncbi:MAG: substrate-binding domain-containing protein [bacterium]
MKKNRLFKTSFMLLLLLILSFTALSCSRQPAQTGGEQPAAVKTTQTRPAAEKPRLGVSLPNRQHDFYKDLEEGLKAEAEKEGFDLIVRDADFRMAKQVSDVEDFAVQKVDALIICPVDSKGVEKAIQTANNAKIPVFTADIAAEGGKVECHVASDNVQGGRKAAEFMGKLLKGDVAQFPKEIGRKTIETVKKFLKGEKIPALIPVEVSIIDKTYLAREANTRKRYRASLYLFCKPAGNRTLSDSNMARRHAPD